MGLKSNCMAGKVNQSHKVRVYPKGSIQGEPVVGGHNMASRLTERNFRWDWTSETWDWNPAEGRWSPTLGRPKGCVLIEVSTDGLPRHQAFDFWRETVFYDFEADRHEATEKPGFSAQARGLIAPRGEFYVFYSDSLSGQTAKQVRHGGGGDDIDLGLVLSGTRLHIPAKDLEYQAGPGEPYFYDGTDPSRVVWSAHHGMCLRLRRPMVETALGGTIPSARILANSLPSSRLWPFLKAQFTLLAQRLNTLSNTERAWLLDNIIDLSLLTLQTLDGHLSEHNESDSTRHGLFIAARRFIAKNLSNPKLDVNAVANAIGCSRATLYRVFAEHELTVAAYIREQRLQRFMRMLQATDNHISITELAYRCGLPDPINVSKTFRRRFGVSPTDFRRELAGGRKMA